LHSEYAQKIEVTPGFKLAGLASTIHADVAASFSELLAKHIGECETRINQAKKRLHDQTFSVAVQVSPQLHSTPRISSRVKASIEAGIASLPSLVTGAVIANLPGTITGMILSTAPTVVASVWWNPLTWAAAAGTGAANAAVNMMGGAVGGALTVIATPLSALAFGFSAYRLIATWRALQDKNKNQLAVSVRELVDEAYLQVQRQLEVYRNQDVKLLEDYQVSIVTELARIEDHLEGALARKPDESAIHSLKQKHRLLSDRRVSLLEGSSAEKDSNGSPQQQHAIVDSLVSKS
jgi:hypothetical protein